MGLDERSADGLDGKRIIVVEDDHILAMDISARLRAVGATVLGPAPTSFYALQLIGPDEKRRLDAAVLDVHLHGKTVYEFADVLADRGVPFLFATAYSPDTIPQRFKQAPVLQKPVSPAALANAVVKLIRKPLPKRMERVVLPPKYETEAPAHVFARALARSMAKQEPDM